MPAALARSAITWPTLAAASAFLPFFRPDMTSDSTVAAEASTLEPSAVNSWAYRCWPVRSTDRRGTPRVRIRARVDLARRRRAVFFSMVFSLRKLKAGLFLKSPHMDVRTLAGDSPLRLLGFLADDGFAGVLHA